MPARDGRSSRRRARTAPELSPESDSEHGAGEAANNDRGRGKRGGQGAAQHGGGAAAGPIKSGAKCTVPATNAEKPELLSRFIPPDPLIGRVSLSSPQRPTTAPGPAVSNGTVVSSSSSPGTGGVGGVSGSSERGVRFRQGAVGLENDGNSCYLNATLQVLARCTPLRTHLMECVGRSSSPNVAGQPCPLALAISQLYGGMWSSEGGDDTPVESAENVLRALVKGNRWFAGYGQHDAHEALRSVLDLLHEELRRPVPASFEPGYAALTAAIAASTTKHSRTFTGSVNGDPQSQPQPPPDKPNAWGKVTTPCTPAGEGAWSENGDVDVEGRAATRAVSGDRAGGPQHEVYWQSVAAETFQGMLLSRITCRACGRHSDQPDRFYDLSLPLLPAAAPAAASTGAAAEAKPRSPPPPASAVSATLGAANARRRDGTSVSPTVESPAREWEPTPTPTPREERRGSGMIGTEGGDGESAAGDRSSDWGTRRRQRGGWCMATGQRDQGRGGDDEDGSGGERREGGGGATSAAYVRGLFSSVRVWLGINSVPLEDCMQAFFSAERLRGANQYHCESCGSKKEADKLMSLLHAPEVLVLHLKRFRRGYLWSHKVHNRVVFPVHDLDVSPWLADHAVELQSRPPASGCGNGGDAHRKSSLRRGSYLGGGGFDGGSVNANASANGTAHSPRRGACTPSPSPVLYDLVGLVQHTGGLEHGHYTCYARDDGSAAWYHFNDTLTERVSQDVVVSAIPYILLYRRKRQSARGTPLAASSSSSASASASTSTVTNAPTISHLAAAGIGPAVEEARDVRSRVELMAREMAKAAGHRTPSRSSIANGSSSAGGKDDGADAGIVGARQNSVAGVGTGGGGGGGVSDTDGEGGGGMTTRCVSVGRRRKGRGRRPGSESESEGGAGPRSWVYLSKAWALKWATCAYPGPVSNHHVVCRHGRVKPNVGVKRATKEVVAVPRGVHRSLVNRYGPRTPAIAARPSVLDANGGSKAVATSASVRAGAADLALVGSSRPLLELVSCTACRALDEELTKVKGAEQTEVARLSRIGQERRKNRKLARQRRDKARRSALNNGCDGARKGIEGRGTGHNVGDDAVAQGEREGVLVATEGGGEDTDGHGPGKPDDSRYGIDEDAEGEKEEWFLMAGTWLTRWQTYILSGLGEDLDFATPPPGPITNGDLVDDDGNPFPGKEAGKNYRGAMVEVWNYLHERYGGGPVIIRSDPDRLYEGTAMEPPPN